MSTAVVVMLLCFQYSEETLDAEEHNEFLSGFVAGVVFMIAFMMSFNNYQKKTVKNLNREKLGTTAVYGNCGISNSVHTSVNLENDVVRNVNRERFAMVNDKGSVEVTGLENTNISTKLKESDDTDSLGESFEMQPEFIAPDWLYQSVEAFIEKWYDGNEDFVDAGEINWAGYEVDVIPDYVEKTLYSEIFHHIFRILLTKKILDERQARNILDRDDLEALNPEISAQIQIFIERWHKAHPQVHLGNYIPDSVEVRFYVATFLILFSLLEAFKIDVNEHSFSWKMHECLDGSAFVEVPPKLFSLFVDDVQEAGWTDMLRNRVLQLVLTIIFQVKLEIMGVTMYIEILKNH